MGARGKWLARLPLNTAVLTNVSKMTRRYSCRYCNSGRYCTVYKLHGRRRTEYRITTSSLICSVSYLNLVCYRFVLRGWAQKNVAKELNFGPSVTACPPIGGYGVRLLQLWLPSLDKLFQFINILPCSNFPRYQEQKHSQRSLPKRQRWSFLTILPLHIYWAPLCSLASCNLKKWI